MSYIGKKNGNPNTDFLEAGGELENHDLVNVDSSGRIITPIVNRTSTDGDVITIAKDGTTVGSIGVDSGDNIYFAGGTGGTGGIYINNSAVYPANTGGPATDNLLNLGSTSIRWKDLYLSGGVYVGGTGSANYLDDYEEGTWTPTAIQGVSGFSVTKATYTKIGNQVTVYFYIGSITGKTSSQLMIGGLPFTVGTSVYMSGVCESDGGGDVGITRAYGGLTDLWFYDTATAPRSDYTGTDLGGGLRGSVTYFTN